MKDKFISFYSDIAERTAQLSKAKRLKVGAVVVKNDNVIAFGYNGTPIGWDNNCETEFLESTIPTAKIGLVTVPEVIHAEQNCIYKLAKGRESAEGSAMFCTHSCCLECAKGVFMSGIKEFYYKTDYRDKKGIDFLKKCGILTIKL